MSLNAFAKEIYQHNKEVGWWDGDRSLMTVGMLIISEIGEAMEGARKDLMDDHLPHRKMVEVELADTLIRTLDLGAHLGLELDEKWIEVTPMIFAADMLNDGHDLEISESLFLLCKSTVMFFDTVFRIGEKSPRSAYIDLVTRILACGYMFQYDIETAAREKFEYNKTRADHKRENRAKEHGKKF